MNKHGAGFMFYIKKIIPCSEISSNILLKNEDLQSFHKEIGSDYVLDYTIPPISPNQNKILFFDTLSKELRSLSVRYYNFILLRDFNLTVENKNLKSFINVFYLKNLAKTPACKKRMGNGNKKWK